MYCPYVDTKKYEKTRRIPHAFRHPRPEKIKNASSGNRTRVTPMATVYSTTRPTMPVTFGDVYMAALIDITIFVSIFITES